MGVLIESQSVVKIVSNLIQMLSKIHDLWRIEKPWSILKRKMKFLWSALVRVNLCRQLFLVFLPWPLLARHVVLMNTWQFICSSFLYILYIILYILYYIWTCKVQLQTEWLLVNSQPGWNGLSKVHMPLGYGDNRHT